MREMVPEATEPYLDHVWKMLTPAAESKAAKKEKSDGVTGAEATERPEGSGAGPERRDRPDAHEGRAGGGTDRGSAPSARGSSSLARSSPDQSELKELRRLFEHI